MLGLARSYFGIERHGVATCQPPGGEVLHPTLLLSMARTDAQRPRTGVPRMPNALPRQPLNAIQASRLRQHAPSLLGGGSSRLSGWLPFAALTVGVKGWCLLGIALVALAHHVATLIAAVHVSRDPATEQILTLPLSIRRRATSDGPPSAAPARSADPKGR
jgi:hypothetical protein